MLDDTTTTTPTVATISPDEILAASIVNYCKQDIESFLLSLAGFACELCQSFEFPLNSLVSKAGQRKLKRLTKHLTNFKFDEREARAEVENFHRYFVGRVVVDDDQKAQKNSADLFALNSAKLLILARLEAQGLVALKKTADFCQEFAAIPQGHQMQFDQGVVALLLVLTNALTEYGNAVGRYVVERSGSEQGHTLARECYATKWRALAQERLLADLAVGEG